ncbi:MULTISPECIES: ABC transporter permease [Actinosynnema]|uniref:ABC transporter permease n=1 Tax=Actinosynnema TaxID=40566 RepID=UPI0020A486F0|nr:ABC transporter permease [Actinosynnema pretiosum]MCP2092194.1 putative ABC transport system permease protein [Actinosynnema pretiosum]
MRTLALASVRHRLGSFAAVVVSVLLASALLTALGVLLESGLRSGVPPQRYAGADVVVGAAQAVEVVEDLDLRLAERAPLPADAAARVAAVPGVREAIPESATAVLVDGVPAQAVGWGTAALAPSELVGGRAPATPTELVLDAGLAAELGASPGSRVPVAVGGVPEEYEVTGVTGTSVPRRPAAYLTDQRALELAGGQVDVVGVLADQGVDPDALAESIAAALPGATTYTGVRRGDAEFLDAGEARGYLITLSSSFAGTTLMIAVLVVASTLALSIGQRARELALLRAVAATPAQIHRMVGTEVLLVSGAAAVLGALPGIWAAGLLRDAFADAGQLPPDFALALSPAPPLAAILLVVGTARFAAWLAVRRPASADPMTALRESALAPPQVSALRARSGWACVASGLVLCALPLVIPGELAAAGAAASAMLTVIGAALLGPRLVLAATSLVSRPLTALAPVAAPLALASVRANARRFASVVVPILLAVTVAGVQVFTQTTVAAAASAQSTEGMRADVVVAGEAGVAPQVTDALREVADDVVPLVRGQVAARHTTLGEPNLTPLAAQGVDTPATVLDLDVREGDLNAMTADSVALSTQAAATLGVSPGDRLPLVLGDGAEITPQVTALYARGLGYGDVTLPHDVLLPHTTTKLDHLVLVRGADEPTVTAALGPFTGVRAVDSAHLASAGESERDGDSWTNLIALVVLLGYLAISVVNTLVMATARRGQEFALLRLVGTRRAQVLRVVRLEALLLTSIALLVGAAAVLPALAGLSYGLTESPIPTTPWQVWATITATTLLLTLTATTIPARTTLRPPPVSLLGSTT